MSVSLPPGWFPWYVTERRGEWHHVMPDGHLLVGSRDFERSINGGIMPDREDVVTMNSADTGWRASWKKLHDSR